MTLARTKAGFWIGASVAVCAILACSVSVTPDGDGVKITVANRVFSFELKVLDPFRLTAGSPAVPQAARINLFQGAPDATPQSARITLPAQSVQAISLVPKALQAAQAVNGSVTVDVSIAAYDANPCAAGVYIGSFDLTVANGSVSIANDSLTLSAAAFAHVMTGSFSICLQVSADVEVEITIDGMTIEFGPPVDGAGGNDNDNENVNGNDNDSAPECVTDDDCADGETCIVGECVAGQTPECVTEDDCPSGETCVGGQCLPEEAPECQLDEDCDAGEVCAGGECVPEDTPLHTLTVSIDGMGSVDPPGGMYAPGAAVILTATAAGGWRFDHWEGDVTGSGNPVTVTMNADTSVTGVFVESAASAVTFRAVYDRLWDTDKQNPGYGILHSAMSGDGERLVWAIRDNNTGALSILTMNVDGSDRDIIPAPAEVDSIYEVVINYDGSRAFFRRWFNLLYKVENGGITKILDIADVEGLGSIGNLQSTRAGDYVYFLDDEPNDNDVWRVAHGGGAAELVINDTDVILHNGFPAAQVAEFDISGAGGIIAFTTHGYWDEGYRSRSELFVKNGGAYDQLTTDGGDYNKSNPRVSGDGSTVVFRRGDSWYSVSPDGANELDLGAAGYNLGGPVLTFDGSRMFYSDSESGGTVILNTDGSGRQNIVPAWNITNIAIGATHHHAMSEDATRVSFYTQYGILPENAAFYVGYVGEAAILASTVASAPSIDAITFSPAAFSRSNPEATLLLLASIGDPDGLSDVTNAAADAMIDGVHSSYDDVPAYFYFAPRDDGAAPDVSAADGVFTSAASAGAMLDSLNEVTIRVSAMDASFTVTVADTVLTITGSN